MFAAIPFGMLLKPLGEMIQIFGLAFQTMCFVLMLLFGFLSIKYPSDL